MRKEFLKEIINELWINKNITWFYLDDFKEHSTLRFWEKIKDPKEFKMNFKQTHIVEEIEIERIVWSVIRISNKITKEQENKIIEYLKNLNNSTI